MLSSEGGSLVVTSSSPKGGMKSHYLTQHVLAFETGVRVPAEARIGCYFPWRCDGISVSWTDREISTSGGVYHGSVLWFD